MRKVFGRSLLMLLLTAASLTGFGQAPESSKPPGGDASSSVHYFNGDIRVERVIALDELELVSRDGTPLKASEFGAVGRRTEVIPGEPGRLAVRFESPASDRAGLDSRAAAMIDRRVDVRAVLFAPGAEERESLTNRLSVRLKDADRLDEILREYDLRVDREIGGAYVLAANAGGLFAAIDAANALYESGEAVFATPLVLRQQQPRFVPDDTYFSQQWHLHNYGQAAGSIAGNDVNVIPAWGAYAGVGVNIAVSDTGVQVAHPDLAAHARTDIDLDINGGDLDPTPASSAHGTEAAGMAAAVGNNALGVTGAAYDAGIVGIRLIEAATTDADEATAMAHQMDPRDTNLEPIPGDRVHVNSNSWGPSDCGCVHETFGPLTESALVDGVTLGRGGLGIVYVWAAGNGRGAADNVNYDGYASSRYTIAVGASGGNGVVSYYSEPGASLLVNTPSSYNNGEVGTTTTTLTGLGDLAPGFTSGFSGTSSAAPLAAGCVALMLEANPNLGWRDVQHILVDTSFKNDPGSAGWFANGAGRKFNLDYGFGRVDADAATARAAGWTDVEPETVLTSPVTPVNAAILDNNSAWVTSAIHVDSVPAGFFAEHVEVILNTNHTFGGDLEIALTSPSGSVSTLAGVHNASANYSNWKFTSVAHWGENPAGDWALSIRDQAPVDSGTFVDWQIIVYGISIGTDEVSVDPTHIGFENGHPNWPFTDLPAGLAAVDSGGVLDIHADIVLGVESAISKAVTLSAPNGPVTISK